MDGVIDAVAQARQRLQPSRVFASVGSIPHGEGSANRYVSGSVGPSLLVIIPADLLGLFLRIPTSAIQTYRRSGREFMVKCGMSLRITS